MDKIELRQATAEASRLGLPLNGYSSRQLTDVYFTFSENARAALNCAPAHIRARILENRLRSLGTKPEPEDIAPLPAPQSELAARLSVLQSL